MKKYWNFRITPLGAEHSPVPPRITPLGNCEYEFQFTMGGWVFEQFLGFQRLLAEEGVIVDIPEVFEMAIDLAIQKKKDELNSA